MRIDVWLWAVRLFKSRSRATEACRGGHVRLNGERAKPASPVQVGHEVTVRGGGHRERIVEVRQLLAKRVGAPRAAEAIIDHSPPPPPKELQPSVPTRPKGAGRPTKRERRQITKLRGY